MDSLCLASNVSELEERYLKAGEKEDELPPQEPPSTESKQSSTLLKMVMNSVDTAHSLISIIRKDHSEAMKSELSADCVERLDNFEQSLDDMLDYFTTCLSEKPEEPEEEPEPDEDEVEPEESEDEEEKEEPETPEEEEESEEETEEEPA